MKPIYFIPQFINLFINLLRILLIFYYSSFFPTDYLATYSSIHTTICSFDSKLSSFFNFLFILSAAHSYIVSFFSFSKNFTQKIMIIIQERINKIVGESIHEWMNQ